MKKSAFTMIELVFVIVVIGILAMVFIPRFERDNAGEAAYQIARHIRLAQHHALVEDRINDAPAGVDWKSTLWQIAFTHSTAHNGDCYDVYADRNGGGNVNSDGEAAIDPLTGKKLYSNNCNEDVETNDDVLLWKKYGVNSVTFSAGCYPGAANKYIAFDHIGRPYGAIGSPLVADCTITLTTKDGHNATITITKETGFVKVATIDGTNLP